MYLRLKNLTDLEACASLFEENGRMPVYDAIRKDLVILDDAYGISRRAFDMGGYVLYFPTTSDFRKDENKIYDAYHMDSNLYESEDVIWQDGMNDTTWKRKLFLLSSDDALVFIYPETNEKTGN